MHTVSVHYYHCETCGSTQEDMGRAVAESSTSRKSLRVGLDIQNPQSTPIVSPFLSKGYNYFYNETCPTPFQVLPFADDQTFKHEPMHTIFIQTTIPD